MKQVTLIRGSFRAIYKPPQNHFVGLLLNTSLVGYTWYMYTLSVASSWTRTLIMLLFS